MPHRNSRIVLRLGLPGDYRFFFFGGEAGGGSSCYVGLELIPLIPILPGNWGIDGCHPPSMP